jgi:hydroxymethylbilane synthase
MPAEKPIIIATRGSALALAQSNFIAEQCRTIFPRLRFELKIIKTTGDKLQKSSLAEGGLPKGLFTKELEVALLKNQADLAVHSLKDLPTEIPAGLKLAATPKRVDVRDVLIYRDAAFLSSLATRHSSLADWSPGQGELRGFGPNLGLKDLPPRATVATSATRRKVQLLAARPDLNIVEIRGNVPTRLQKISERGELDATVLAFAGMTRLNFRIESKPGDAIDESVGVQASACSPMDTLKRELQRPHSGKLIGDAVPDGLLATVLDLELMLPCVGQGAIGIEIRAEDERIDKICERLNHFNTFQCVTAERAFLQGMGGGCQSPVAAFAEVVGEKISMRAVSFRDETAKRGEGKRPLKEALVLGEELAAQLK